MTDTVSYSLDDSAGGLFAIDSATGVSTVAGAIDYETAHSYTVIVRARSTDTSFSTQSFTINVLDVNDNPPTLNLDSNHSLGAAGLDYATTFTEDAGPVKLGDVDLTINDLDSPIINSVVITITNRFDGLNELLAADTAGTTITAVYAGGTLTLSGADTLAHYQQVLQTVTYENLSNNANLTDRVITFTSSDGSLVGPVATATVHMVGMPDAPTLTSPALIIATEDTVLVLNSSSVGTAFVADVDSATLQVSITVTAGDVSLATTAGLTFLTGDGLHDATLVFTGTQAALNAALDGISFTPAANFNGLSSIAWTVTDPTSLSASTITTIDVAAVNDAPTITGPATININEDTPAVFNTANGNAFQVADIDVGVVKVTLSAAHGTLSLASLTGLTFVVGTGTGDSTVTFCGTVSAVNAALDGLAFTPSANYHGAAVIQAFVDDQGNTGAGGVLSDSLTTNIAIASVNDAPVGVNDTINTRNIDTILITTSGFLANDTDVDGDPLTAVLLTRPTHGTFVASGGGAWLYVPDATYFGNDTFTYIATDGQLSSQPITVTIVISIAGGPNSGGAAQSAGALGGVISSALITSATKDESTAVVMKQHFSAASIAIEREAVNEAPIGPLQNNQNQQLTAIDVRSLDSENLVNTAFRSALFVRPETSVRMDDTSITRLLTSTTMYTPFNVGAMNTMLDGLRDQVEMRWESMSISTGSVAVTAVGLTAGYAIWALRGAHLVATLLTTMPAWWSIDPLPILTASNLKRMTNDDHDESLADIAVGAKNRQETIARSPHAAAGTNRLISTDDSSQIKA
ncbi:MAG: tandem-95 repeat protein [Planctomycetaceae bacterium]|nr:tandem-95 repeat protein [Planctomycetaceae bacterium]